MAHTLSIIHELYHGNRVQYSQSKKKKNQTNIWTYKVSFPLEKLKFCKKKDEIFLNSIRWDML